jgi:hypothetical protein
VTNCVSVWQPVLLIFLVHVCPLSICNSAGTKPAPWPGQCIIERIILGIDCKIGKKVLFFMPDRTNCILLVSALVVSVHEGREPGPVPRRGLLCGMLVAELALVCTSVCAQVEAKNGLENYAYNLRNTIRDDATASKLDAADKERLEKAIGDVVTWLENNQLAEVSDRQTCQRWMVEGRGTDGNGRHVGCALAWHHLITEVQELHLVPVFYAWH